VRPPDVEAFELEEAGGKLPALARGNERSVVARRAAGVEMGISGSLQRVRQLRFGRHSRVSRYLQYARGQQRAALRELRLRGRRRRQRRLLASESTFA
jgi:hypothetical protein